MCLHARQIGGRAGRHRLHLLQLLRDLSLENFDSRVVVRPAHHLRLLLLRELCILKPSHIGVASLLLYRLQFDRAVLGLRLLEVG